MTFSSLEFLFVFFPVVLGINFILPKKVKNYWLLAASLFFYAWGEPTFFFLLILSTIVNYCSALVLSKAGDSITSSGKTVFSIKGKFPKIWKAFHTCPSRKILFVVILILNIGCLFVTKYLNFLTSELRRIFPCCGSVIPQTSFILPLGFSFITFQSVSYIIDVYRGMPPEKNYFFYTLYITFFPQLLQGPILRYTDFHPFLTDRKTTLKDFESGIIRFLTGLNQKVLLANILSEISDKVFEGGGISFGMAWLGMVAFSFQLYFDFAGYSDMAIGLGYMFGFRFKENFDFPYASNNMTEFWRRWHISLGTWFRDYLYFPLGGSRVKRKSRLVFNITVIWLATGIWHGASWTFILWGLLHGFFIIFEKLSCMPEKLKKRPALQWFYRGVIILAVMYGWMLFRVQDISQALAYTRRLLKFTGNPWKNSLFRFYSREYIFTLIFSVICAFPLCKKIRDGISSKGIVAANTVKLFWYLLQLGLAVVSISWMVMSSHNPFLYESF